MRSLVIAVWVLVGVVGIGTVSILIFVIKTRASVEGTLQETQNLLKKVESQINNIGKNLEATTGNANGAMLHLKNTLRNTERTTAFVNQIAPFATILLLLQGFTTNTKTESKNRSILNNIMNIGKLFAAIQQGFSLYKKFSSKKKEVNYGRK